jgi:hypothetical protein
MPSSDFTVSEDAESQRLNPDLSDFDIDIDSQTSDVLPLG